MSKQAMINHRHVIRYWFAWEDNDDTIKSVLVIETDLELNRAAASFDATIVENMINDVKKQAVHHNLHYDHVRVVQKLNRN